MKTLTNFRNLSEKVVDIGTSDFKILPSGRKQRHKRFKVGEKISPEQTKPEWEDPNNDPNYVNIKEHMNNVANSNHEPPYVLILQRKAIRLYPNNVSVALYYNKQLDKYFSVPYGQHFDVSGIIQAEEKKEKSEFQRKRNDAATSDTDFPRVDESVMNQLHQIADSKSAKSVKFATGETRKVDHFTASAITKIHKALNDENKKKFADMVHKSPTHLMKAADFAFKHIK